MVAAVRYESCQRCGNAIGAAVDVGIFGVQQLCECSGAQGNAVPHRGDSVESSHSAVVPASTYPERPSSRELTWKEALQLQLDGMAAAREGHLSRRGHEAADYVMQWGVELSTRFDDVSVSDENRRDLGERVVEVWVGGATIQVLAAVRS